MRATLPVGAVCLAVLLAPLTAAGGYEEHWTTDPPGNNDWKYFVEGAPHNGNVPMNWHPAGGQSGGYVSCPLGQLTQWSEMPGVVDYWPAYTLDSNHPIDLNQDSAIRIYVRSGLAGPAFNLGGGTLHFWIGEWVDPDGEGGEDPMLSFFYFDTPIPVTNVWQQNTLLLNSSDWTLLREDQGKTAADLFAGPQQWGFGIFGGQSAPVGTLAFDTFQNIPEPLTMSLLALGGAAVLLRRRR